MLLYNRSEGEMSLENTPLSPAWLHKPLILLPGKLRPEECPEFLLAWEVKEGKKGGGGGKKVVGRADLRASLLVLTCPGIKISRNLRQTSSDSSHSASLRTTTRWNAH